MDKDKARQLHKEAKGHLIDAIQCYHKLIVEIGEDVSPMLLIGSVCNDTVELVDKITEMAKEQGKLI